MSHDYRLYCPRCRAYSDTEYNHGDEMLARAVRESYPLWLLARTGWDAASAAFEGHAPVAGFVLDHWEHGGFWVVSEYWQAGDAEKEARYPPVAVTPDVPGDVGYETLALSGLVVEAKRVRDDIAGLLVRIDRKQEGS